ncbi:YqeG family HAD IIIA-type phosphatase [Desulforamulus profundi]|uniref:YqeG family HAD IIIA-type phosphatase n=1 Tax=Desulforamulus profundi TaxID=1383067 RepID=UPI003083966B
MLLFTGAGGAQGGQTTSQWVAASLSLVGTDIHETAFVGDQVFTDVLAGNRLGLYTILVTPLAGKEFIGTRINRKLEKLVLGRIKNNNHRY